MFNLQYIKINNNNNNNQRINLKTKSKSKIIYLGMRIIKEFDNN